MKEKIKQFNKGYKIKVFIAFVLLGILLTASLSLLYLKISDGAQTSRENQGYVRYLACVTDIRNELNVIAISDEISDACWAEAEKEVGVQLSRYSEKVLLNNFER